MCPNELENQSNTVESSRRTRYGVASLLVAGLTVLIVIGVVFVEGQMGYIACISTCFPGDAFRFRPIRNAILLGASVLPIFGFVLARKGTLKGTEPKSASTLGLIANTGLSLVALTGLIWAFWFYFMMAKVEGVFLINGETAKDPLISLENEFTWKKVETTKKDGSFAFYGLKPGIYSLHASSYLPPPVTCVSVPSDNRLEITNPSSDYYLINVLVDANDLLIPPGLTEVLYLDISLMCQ